MKSKIIELEEKNRCRTYQTEYLSKDKTLMTKGLAILCMVILHLFCRKGNEVYGTPLLWLTSGVPVVYILGFLAEICVPLYSMCSGYAHYAIGENNRLGFKNNLKRIFRFLLNYWIVVILFSLLGLLVRTPDIPVSISDFLQNLFMLSTSYNGAWWYAATYVFLCLCSGVIYTVVKRVHWIFMFLIASLQYGVMYVCDALDLIPKAGNTVINFALRQFDNFFGDVLLCYILGMLMVKLDVFGKINYFLQTHVSIKRQTFMGFKILLLICVSAVVFIFEKAIIMPYYAVFIFILFNSSNLKGKVKACFIFLGHHSTNIWLTHMFFYLCMFQGLVISARYPVFIFVYMMILCVAVSFVINFIYEKVISWMKLSGPCE